MSVSFAQENNIVTEYYEGENKARNAERHAAATRYIPPRNNTHLPFESSSLNPLKKKKEPKKNARNMNNYLTPEERNLLKLVRGYGGRRTRRSRSRHRGSRRR
jgi:hypothetical protein